jgi:hypothetical protein
MAAVHANVRTRSIDADGPAGVDAGGGGIDHDATAVLIALLPSYPGPIVADTVDGGGLSPRGRRSGRCRCPARSRDEGASGDQET